MRITTLSPSLSVTLATWFGIGKIPFAPGTWGSLAAVFCAVPIVMAGGSIALFCAAILVAIVGIPISTQAAVAMGKKDPGSIVIDEVAGQWIALAAAPYSLGGYALAFIAFRFFDIMKPWPVCWADRNLADGLGIMMDDILAGILAAIVVWFIAPYLPATPYIFEGP